MPVFTTPGPWLRCRAYCPTDEPDPNCRAPLYGIALGGTLAYALRPEQTLHQVRARERARRAVRHRRADARRTAAYDAALTHLHENLWDTEQYRAADLLSLLQRFVVLDVVLPLSAADLLLRSQAAPDGTSYNELEADAMLGLDYCTRNNRRCRW